MISIPAFLLCLFTFTTNSHSVPEDPESLATNEGAPAWPDGTIILQPPQLRHIKQTVVQELRLNSFQVSAESGTFRLNLRAIEVGAELTVGISQQVPANIVWVVINFSLASGVSEVVTAERMQAASQHTIYLKRAAHNTELLLIAKGIGMKSFAVFYMAQHSHYERNLALIWLCGIGIFLVAIGLASNAIYLEGSVQYYSIPKSTVTKKYTILELANRVSEQECSICMGSFEEGSLLAVTDCYHVYHANCFQPWCAIHGKCPYCREPLIAYFNLIDSPSYRLPIQHYQQVLSQRNQTVFKFREPSATKSTLEETAALLQNAME